MSATRETARRGIALIAHPHPLMGGTKDNKVVHDARAQRSSHSGYVALRPNFRGVGATHGRARRGPRRNGRPDRGRALRAGQIRTTAAHCAGFSFGSFVQTRVAKRHRVPHRLVLVGAGGESLSRPKPSPADTLVIHGEERRHRAACRGARLGAAAGAARRGGARRRALLPRQAASAAQIVDAALPMTRTSSRAGCASRTATHEVVAGIDLELEARRVLRPARPERRRQDHHAAAVPRADRPRRAATISCSASRCRARAREARARVGVVPQIDNLDPDFTVRENLLVYGRYFGLSQREIDARIPALLEFAGLAGRADAQIKTLSGGMKRRLTLARALVNDPRPHFPRRADDRPRSAGAPPDLGAAAPAARRRARRSSSPRTSWTRPSACATGSRSWTTAASSPRARRAS